MTFTALLDTAIGLTLLYLGTALFVTILNESIAGLLNKRGKDLAASLEALLGADLNKWVRQEPAFQPMLKGEKLRSYVDPHLLAQVIVGSLARKPEVAPAVPATSDLLASIGLLPDSQLKNVLWTMAQIAKNDVEKLTEQLSIWIDRSLTVLGEGYKRWIHVLSLGLGLAIAIAFNIDTVTVVRRLYVDKDLRDAIASDAQVLTQKVPADVFDRCRKLDAEQLKTSAECAPLMSLTTAVTKRAGTLGKLPIGWDDLAQVSQKCLPWNAGRGWFVSLVGWILTALAVSLGAPFWFDLLNRFVNVRVGIRRPDVAS